MSDLTFKIVRETKVNTPESLKTIPVGSSVRIACKDFVSMNTVQAAICRLNQQAGYVEYKVTSPDNGATLDIYHYAAKGCESLFQEYPKSYFVRHLV